MFNDAEFNYIDAINLIIVSIYTSIQYVHLAKYLLFKINPNETVMNAVLPAQTRADMQGTAKIVQLVN